MRQTEALITERVKALLDERSISAAELARRLEVSQSYVARRMTGAVPWRAADLALIAAQLDVPVTQFLPSDVVPAS